MMFKCKTVLVTGASSGIGKAQAELFLEHGACVVGVDKQDAKICHVNYTHIQADVTCVEQVNQLPTSIDILVNSAGILDDYLPSDSTSLELWKKIIDTNVTSMFLVTNHLLPSMLERQSGIIVNMASIAGLLAGGGGAAYTASKHAVVGYTKQLAYDYAAKGIRINALAPGAIKTAMTAKDFAGDGALAKWVAEQTPLKRWGEPIEIAQATLFLAGEQASFMHGQVLVLDGGWSLS
ncbi:MULTISPECIES: 3-oxoacyl-ACP reductase [unclassified Granulicatella]|uniref:3-oxoacyl-ACP reductase n=1 Tax=unclassified Granulicatella TaxID=2630493 RepID=UPI0010749232|nr:MULTISPECIES: 3-oxoacyl-ACP reductase [unclassified Granulicatella]MBF0779944.1 3-oxoacyl-ACP reductase [Granulicatella sp. 19428wC4_WM01]TFU95961.1 3-oxoacyl-ACP reductase [Granulicatella sp. WM01]